MPIARVISIARASNIQRYGGTSQEAPTISPSCTVSIRTGGRPGDATSSATRPWRIRKNSSALAPSRTRYWPASKRWLRAQPVTMRRCSGAKPAGNGCSPRMRSSVSMWLPFGLLLPFGQLSFDRFRRGCFHIRPDRGRLLCDVDADRVPRNAAAAAHAARGAELVDPVGELVGHPLPVARSRRLPHASAMDVRERHVEARVPHAHPLGRRPGEVGVVLHARAEAGRAAFRHLIPARMLEVALQQLLQPLGL